MTPLKCCLLVVEQQGVNVPLDQPGRPDSVPGGQRVPDSVIGQTMLIGPGGRVMVQLPYPARLVTLQPGAQQVGEQVVVAPPAAHFIQRHQDQAGPLHLLQHRLAAGAAGDRIAQFPGQPVQHRGFEQELAHLLTLPLQHLVGQVVQHEAVAAGERGDEPGRIRLPAQRQPGQLQPCRPPFGAVHQGRHRRIGQARPGRLAQ